MDLREVLSLFFRYWRMIAVAAAVPMVLAAIAFLMAHSEYMAVGRILVRVGREASSSDQFASNSARLASDSELMNSEIEIINSQAIAEQIAHEFAGRLTCSPTPGPGDFTSDVQRFTNNFKAELVQSSYVIQVTYVACSRDLAQQVLQRYIELYQQKHIEAYAHPLPSFLADREAQLRSRLQSLDDDIAQYRVAHGVYDPAAERSKLVDVRTALVAKQTDLTNSSAELTAKLDALKKTQASLSPMIESGTDTTPSSSYSRARDQLFDLQVQEKQLLTRFTPDSKEITGIRAQEAAVKKLVDTEQSDPVITTHRIRNPMYDEVATDIAHTELELAPAQVELAAVVDQIKQTDARLALLENVSAYLTPRLSDRDQIASQIKDYESKQQDATVLAELDNDKIANVALIEPISTLPNRVSPRLSKFLLFGLGGSAAFFLLAVGALFVTHRTFMVPEALERAAGIPVVVSVRDAG